jgi:hypothetical protein
VVNSSLIAGRSVEPTLAARGQAVQQFQPLSRFDFEGRSDYEPAECVSLIDEMRLRTWARQNYASPDERDPAWHPVVLDEMWRIEREEA